MIWTIELYGKPVAKKNAQVEITTKKGKKVRRYNKETRSALDALAMQIPGWARDLRLEHPEVIFDFECPNGAWDRDNSVTSLVDILKTMGVIVNDNVAHFNGRVTINSARPSPEWKTTITLVPGPARW